MSEIHNMKLHDVITIDAHNTRVLRVPGGWIYRFWEYVVHASPEYRVNSVFVPYNKEFDPLVR